MDYRQQFVQQLMPYAIAASKATGVDPRIIIGQSAIETGFGRSAPGNNFFGIKSHGVPGGQVLATSEYGAQGKYGTQDSFRQYGNMEESANDYARFITTNPRYKDFRAAQGIDAQLAALQKSGYATDPDYATKVGNIARGIDIGNASYAAVPDASNKVASAPSAPAAPSATPTTAAETPKSPMAQMEGLLGDASKELAGLNVAGLLASRTQAQSQDVDIQPQLKRGEFRPLRRMKGLLG